MTGWDEEVIEVKAGTAAWRGRIGDRTPSLAAVQAVAAFRVVEPTAMEVPLHDSIDLDALDRLLQRQSEQPITVTFGVGGDLIVEMSNEGGLNIYERPS